MHPAQVKRLPHDRIRGGKVSGACERRERTVPSPSPTPFQRFGDGGVSLVGRQLRGLCRTGLRPHPTGEGRGGLNTLFAIFDGKGGGLSRGQPADLRTNLAQLGFLTTSSAAQWRLATRSGRRERGVCSRWLPSYANTACGTRCSECVSDPAGAWPWFWKPPTGRVAGVSGPCLRHGGSTQHRREHGRLTDVGGLACGEQSQVSVLR
jgi:hypothetical protein